MDTKKMVWTVFNVIRYSLKEKPEDLMITKIGIEQIIKEYFGRFDPRTLKQYIDCMTLFKWIELVGFNKYKVNLNVEYEDRENKDLIFKAQKFYGKKDVETERKEV